MVMTGHFKKAYQPKQGLNQPAKLDFRGMRWKYLTAEGRSWLADYEGGNLQSVLVKKNIKRRIVQSDDVFIKEINYRGIRRFLKTLNGGTACKEGRMHQKLHDLGLAVPYVLGFGSKSSLGLLRQRDILLTGKVQGVNLDRFIEESFPQLSFNQKNSLIRQFADFIKTLHRQGVFHSDLHVGNVLVTAREGCWEFVLLDTDKVSLHGKPLSSEDEARSLGMLLNSVRTTTTRQHKFRFLKYYGVGFDRPDRSFLSRIHMQFLGKARRVWRRKARKSLFSNRRFVSEYQHDYRIHRNREGLCPDNFRELLSDLDGYLEKGRILKAGNTVRAGMVEINGQNYFLKRYNVKGWWYSFRNAFRSSRAVRTWHNMWAFHVRNLPVPVPLACIERRRFRLLKDSYILTEYIPVDSTMMDLWPRLDDEKQKSLLAIMGILLGEMHNTLCIHGDLKWNNFLVSEDLDKLVYITDLDGSRILNSPGKLKYEKDLKRFLRDLRGFDDNRQLERLFLKAWSSRVF
jgi:tRNA A-37 threonylcarbamoyl transferase component Bud32